MANVGYFFPIFFVNTDFQNCEHDKQILSELSFGFAFPILAV